LGPSLAVMADARKGSAEVRVRNYADRYDNPGTLRRVGAATERFPVLLNGRRVVLPAIHMRGQLGRRGVFAPGRSGFSTTLSSR
jgi:hypothetical protein